VATALQRRKVLVFGDDSSVRNLHRILVRTLEHKHVESGNAGRALAAINRKEFDGVLLDLRCPNRQPKERIRGIGKIWPSLMDKVLVMTIEVSDPHTLELLERYLFDRLPRSLHWLLAHP
jgi:DNA-binding NtrC family response regulator